MTTGTESLNATTGSPEGDILPGIATTLPIDNLAEGEWREVRVTADLPRPGLEELLYLTISLAAPYTITTPNGAPVTFDFRRERDRPRLRPGPQLQQGPSSPCVGGFIVAGRDAPELVPPPTLQAG
ncbi:MAG: hypothetical protein LLF90_05830 [Methanomicrobiaceae archaeon]|uniref:hypothetical protein n=1 Tax=Methanoculleus sp. TaxID=90427 RepID=UPI00320D698C|nr:hypothetical protein [Methanomicrobiaceae archaeon]